jgi:tetratricopeptide (TPR) repeat protein
MRKISYLIACIALWTLSTAAYAEWMSDIDRKYERRSPATYAKVREASQLIPHDGGRTPSDLPRAVELLTTVLRTDPGFAPAHLQMARAIISEADGGGNRFDRQGLLHAADSVALALRIEPDYDYPLALSAYTKMFLKQLDDAERIYKRLLDSGSGYPYLHTQYAQLALRRGDAATAVARAQHAYELHKDDPKLALAAITEMLMAYPWVPGDTTAEEEKWYARRVAIDPHPWNWHAHANFRLYRLGDYESSIRYGTKALSLMDFPLARYTLAAAYYKKWHDLKDAPGRQREAEEAFRQAAALYADTGDMIRRLLAAQQLRSTGEALQRRKS